MSATVWSKVLQFFPTLLKGNSGAAPSINWPSGSVQSITLNAATVTPTFVPTVGGANLALVITQDGVGGRAVTWPAAVSWIGGTAPILLSGAGQTTLVYFYWDGTTYWGSLASGASPASIIPWTAVAAGTALAASLAKPNLAADSSGAQSTITLPTAAQMAASDGYEFTIKATGAMLSPVIVSAGAGTTLELLNAPGTFGASTWLPIQGQSVVFKYDLATTTFKMRASSEGSGAPGTSAYNPNWYAKTDVYWDPQAGVDSASGSIGAPVLTFAEIVRRYGINAPTVPNAQNLTVHQLTAQAAGTDPVFFFPRVSGGSQAVLLGTLIANGATFSPTTVTAKNRATPQLLVLNVVPAGVVAKNLIQNTTSALRGWAFVDSVAATNATMSQPLANSTITTPGTPTLTEDNAWANTDTYQAYTLPLCNLKAWRPTGGDESAAPVASGGWVQFVEVADSSGSVASEFPFVCDSAVNAMSACRIDTRVHTSALSGRGQGLYLIGCDVTGALNHFTGQPEIYGGVLRAGWTIFASSILFDGDLIQHGTCTLGTGEAIVGAVYGDSALVVQMGFVKNSVAFWGTSTLTLDPNGVWWNSSGTTFALSLLITGALKIGTNANATPPSVGGTFVLNGITQVNVAPAGGQHFPANALIALSLNTVGATPGVVAPYFSAAQIADQFSVKSGTALANDTFNWRAFDGSVAITPANLDLYNGLYNEATGARFCNTT